MVIGVKIMLLDLHTIIANPGSVPFSYESDISDMHFDSVSEFLTPLRAEGKVVNSADVLTLTATLNVKMLCVCDRCGVEYEQEKTLEITAKLAEDLEDEENPEIFLVEDNKADLDEILITSFVLDMDTKFLCSEDCPGLCHQCGKPLRDGPCDCKKDIDPRLAVLGQLLNDN